MSYLVKNQHGQFKGEHNTTTQVLWEKLFEVTITKANESHFSL